VNGAGVLSMEDLAGRQKSDRRNSKKIFTNLPPNTAMAIKAWRR
jgi:hypothetical protein